MTERTIGSALRRQLELLGARIELLESNAARAEGRTIDWAAVDETRIDLDRALDELDADIQAAISSSFGQVATALRRRIAAGEFAATAAALEDE